MVSSYEDRELAFTPVYQLKELIKQKKLSSVELFNAIFRRIEEINPKLNAYLTLAQEEAYKAARDAERAVMTGEDLGPLHGIPVSIKDLVETKGIRTTFGSLVFRDNIPQTEGPMVKRLKEAGAIIIGKTNCPEGGAAGYTENKLGDACRNPWNTDRTPGGSSGGAAAAVAAGISPLAQGGDGGGSIRIPASFSGIYGIKPTNGRVPLDVKDWGILSNACLGPMTRNVRDAALMLNVMAGPDKSDYTCIRKPHPDYLKALDSKMGTLRIAWSVDLGYEVHVDSDVVSMFKKAVKIFEDLGHRIEEAAPKTVIHFDTWEINVASRSFIPYRHLLEEHPDELTDYFKAYVECGRDATGVEVAKSWVEVEKIRGACLDFFEEYDLLLTPTVAIPAFKIGLRDKSLGKVMDSWAFCPFSAIFNLSRNPAASVPCGFSSDGLPIGLQIVGRLEDEATVLQASAAFEQACPWADKYPPVS
ncbi:MAG TPA: amidase [Dehalococcoidales bacterium]|nr:amidase [Dehalococcoidales bacterium]